VTAAVIPLPIQTERLIIRPLELNDADALHFLYSNADALQHLTDRENLPTTPEQSAAWVQAKIDLHERTGLSLWAVVEQATGAVIGDAGLQHLEPNEIELATRLLPDRWNRGYATEIGTALLSAGFDHLPIDHIVGITAPNNHAAQHVLQQLGMTADGTQTWSGRTWSRYVTYRR
jgi:RimJ/RimL family protein N-acetyltransferase